MNDQTKILVALGASAAANCHVCMNHHVGRAREADIDTSDIRMALEVGISVAKGAQGKTRTAIDELTGDAPVPKVGPTAHVKCC